jgi:hypothetical protein
MKVKLLKKIRKRFSIIKVEELSSNPTYYDLVREAKLGLPYYVVDDNEFDTLQKDIFSTFAPLQGVYKTHEKAINALHRNIVSLYSEKFRHKDSKETKVWWIKK